MLIAVVVLELAVGEVVGRSELEVCSFQRRHTRQARANEGQAARLANGEAAVVAPFAMHRGGRAFTVSWLLVRDGDDKGSSVGGGEGAGAGQASQVRLGGSFLSYRCLEACLELKRG